MKMISTRHNSESACLKPLIVSDGENTFNVLENDCPQTLVNAEFSGESLSTSAVRLFWESFSFSEEVAEYTQSVECVVQFCITEDCAPAEC